MERSDLIPQFPFRLQTATIVGEENRAVTVHLKPDQAQIVGEAIRAGLIETPDDVVDVGVETIRQWLKAGAETPPSDKTLPVHLRARNLVELFAESPFKGLDLDFERDRDTDRNIDL